MDAFRKLQDDMMAAVFPPESKSPIAIVLSSNETELARFPLNMEMRGCKRILSGKMGITRSGIAHHAIIGPVRFSLGGSTTCKVGDPFFFDISLDDGVLIEGAVVCGKELWDILCQEPPPPAPLSCGEWTPEEQARVDRVLGIEPEKYQIHPLLFESVMSLGAFAKYRLKK